MNILTNAFLNFAQAYGSGTYGSCTYDLKTCSTAASDKGLLANTGFAVGLVITAACLIIFTALLVRFWRHKKTS